jgi:hypothetical protein
LDCGEGKMSGEILSDKEKEMLNAMFGNMMKDEMLKMMEERKKNENIATQRFTTLDTKLDIIIQLLKK